jgi:hypothetical protein
VLKSRSYIFVLVFVGVFAVGCSDSTASTTLPPDTSVTSAEDVVFGSGELPETLPDNLPVPQGSVVGTTMVVTKTGVTEVVLRINAGLDLSVQFFDQGLAQAGFSVASSLADDSDVWLIEYSDSSAKGTILFTESVEGITDAVVRHNVP